jgi:hypothetical protein
MRNRWAHNDQLSDMDAIRTADHAVRLLTLLGDTDGAAKAKVRRTELIAAYATKTGVTATIPAPAPDPTPIAVASSPEPSLDSPAVIGTERFEYEPWEVVEAGGPEVIDALPKKDAKMQVRGVAAEIAEFEGPVSLDRLVTLTVRSFGMTRCGVRKKRQIARHPRRC